MENGPTRTWQRRKVFGVSRGEGRVSARAALSSQESARQSLCKNPTCERNFIFSSYVV